MIYLDTETCGFHGMPILLQYAIDDGPIILHDVWTKPIKETLKVVEEIATHEGGICGFNLSFDWFMIAKLWTTFSLCDPEWVPEEYIDEIAVLEEKARDGDCIKPVSACDLMLWARKTHYQVLMERSDIRIKRVPTPLAHPLAKELEKRVKLDKIFFARKKNPFAPQWNVYDIKDEDEDVLPDFKDVVLKFAPSSGLKTLAAHALKLEPDSILLFSNIEVASHLYPNEDGWAPFALAIGKPGSWNGAWPEKVIYHIAHWETNELARSYARKDVELTRSLYKHFGSPRPGDDDSELACMVGVSRWKGYKVDLDGIRVLRDEAVKKTGQVPTAPGACKRWLEQVVSETERLFMKEKGNSTKRVILEKMANFLQPCPKCDGEGCKECRGAGEVPTESARRAKAILEARFAQYEIGFYEKLLQAGRLHADLNVIGALSSRMSGTSGLNVQGIKKTKEVRSKFPMAFEDEILLGGDFKSFEVTIAIAVYGDERLYADVTTPIECYKCKGLGKTEFCFDCSGKGEIERKICESCNGLKIKEGGDKCYVCKGKKTLIPKIHGLMGTLFFPFLTYEQVVDSDGTDNDYYTKAKSGFFALIYGGEEYTLQERLGVEPEAAAKAVENVGRKYPKIKESRENDKKDFGAMTQLGGIGSKITWTDPLDYVEEPVLGHRRYFTLENMITKELFNLAQKPPAEWRGLEFTVVRRDREQKVAGAVSSALYAAAFGVRSGVVRAAQNHKIQSAGAKICKNLQREIWDLQPSGVSKWIVRPLNVHDELLSASDPEYKDKIQEILDRVIKRFQDKVKLLQIDWKEMKNWAEKK